MITVEINTSFLVLLENENYVKSAAIRIGDVLHTGTSHFSIITKNFSSKGKHLPPNAEDGFVDNFGNFLSREKALILARKTGQIRVKPKDSQMRSEFLVSR